MPTYEMPQAIWILLGVIVLLLALVWFGQLRMGSRLRRIEHQLSRDHSMGGTEEPSSGDRRGENQEQKRIFNEFLEEDPERRLLAKKEQFAAFRKWRREKGLNWSPERQ